MLKVRYTSKFKSDFRTVVKRGYNPNLFQEVLELLMNEKEMPEKYKDHGLRGKWLGFRECHIARDWLLIYHIAGNELILTLTRTGTHSDLFS
jgi:mRNA interferase YafQ